MLNTEKKKKKKDHVLKFDMKIKLNQKLLEK